ncbi:hypothetical protein DEU56DRAFT_762104 [Suillus clintonianus]|uniref:uncharacterized protein n=1 Tax=Suillus clintonianus TaxID=1904413 RepID=UPI001B866A89|nr:uncharacterized protein DEU56DRAFT_762104 [Suillus clintonianus]KAG2112096.1 hypothetical protein DEU56DRAFT_762104 [Suillus clintonianus]
MSLACISVRPLVISHVSHSEKRRTLPPMSGNHPKLGTLRRCTSLEWVYDTDAPSDGSIDEGRLVIRVGDDVSIFPLDERAVPSNDGSLPTMSYWTCGLTYSGTTGGLTWRIKMWTLQLAVGDYELVLSDHKSVVDMHCVEDIVRYDEGDLSQPQIPTATLYHRWNISMKFTTHRNVLQLQEVNIENSQVSTNCSCNSCDIAFSSPITCNDTAGLVAGGSMRLAMKLGKLPDGWMDDLQPTVDTSANEIIRRYSCPTVQRGW